MPMDLHRSTELLQLYIEQNNYCGYDPYDALKSPVFKLPVLKSNKKVRFLLQQLVKRFPLNLRPLLGVPKGYNPVTLGLCIQGYANLLSVYPGKEKELNEKINYLIDELQKLRSKKLVNSSGPYLSFEEGRAEVYSGACWGYDFPWEARYASIPAYQPTVVATGIISNALYIAYKTTGNKRLLEMCSSACNFILNDLKKTFDAHDGSFCFSYSPFDRQVVFNASMKAVRLLAQVYAQTKNETLKTVSRKAVEYVMKRQNPHGSWPYSTSKVGGWVDNYHTGYILDCLHEYILCTGDNTYMPNLEKGFDFYFGNFFHNNTIPKFYDKELYPVDCTSAAQSLLTLCRFGKIKTAQNIASYMTQNMQDQKGYFYFRKFKNHTEKIPFMRWSNAWMFAALTTLLACTHNTASTSGD